MARWTHVAALSLLVAALAGCVDEADPVPPTTPMTDPTPEPGVPPAATEAVAAVEPTEVPFRLEGATPASVGVCGVPDPVGPCASHVLDAGDYVLEVPHEGNVSAIVLTLTFDPATPAVTELFHMLHVDDGTTNTMLSGGPLSNGDEVELSGLTINASATITFFAWPVGHETPVGGAWVDPMSQEFVVEGALMTIRTAA